MTQETQAEAPKVAGEPSGENVASEGGFSRHPEFAVHMLNEKGKERAGYIRDCFDVLLSQLETVCSPGRELAITKTKLEEACFFAKKAMAVNLNNQQH